MMNQKNVIVYKKVLTVNYLDNYSVRISYLICFMKINGQLVLKISICKIEIRKLLWGSCNVFCILQSVNRHMRKFRCRKMIKKPTCLNVRTKMDDEKGKEH